MDDLTNLYKIYESNFNSNQQSNDISPIKVGDIIVALYENREIRGEVSSLNKNFYFLKGKNGNSIKVTMDDVIEHYPKNVTFESKNKKSIEDGKNIIAKKKKDLEDSSNQELKNNPDNQVDLTVNENIKKIGKLLYYQKSVKYSQITEMFDKKVLIKENCWYLLTEKDNEIHIIRNNERGFRIQSFTTALIQHFSKARPLNESNNQIRIRGNDEFSIISNIPQTSYKNLLEKLIILLSK